MDFLVTLVAKHDAVADRLPKFGESCEWQNVVQLHRLVFKRLSAVRASVPVLLIHLAFDVAQVVSQLAMQ